MDIRGGSLLAAYAAQVDVHGLRNGALDGLGGLVVIKSEVGVGGGLRGLHTVQSYWTDLPLRSSHQPSTTVHCGRSVRASAWR